MPAECRRRGFPPGALNHRRIHQRRFKLDLASRQPANHGAAIFLSGDRSCIENILETRQLGHSFLAGRGHYLVRRSLSDGPSLFQHDDPFAKRKNFFPAVGDIDDRDAMLAFQARRSSTILDLVAASSPARGSSSRRIAGSITRARASATLCRSPPESCRAAGSANARCGMIRGWRRCGAHVQDGRARKVHTPRWLRHSGEEKSQILKHVAHFASLRRNIHGEHRCRTAPVRGGNLTCVRRGQAGNAIEQRGLPCSRGPKQNRDAWRKGDGRSSSKSFPSRLRICTDTCLIDAADSGCDWSALIYLFKSNSRKERSTQRKS